MLVERSKFGRLPIRVTPFEGETLGSLFVRAAAANSVSNNHLGNHIGIKSILSRRLGFRQDLDECALATLLGVEREAVSSRLVKPASEKEDEVYRLIHGLTWARWTFFDDTVHMPLGCSSSNLHIKTDWTISGVTWCADTNTFLARCCPQCSEPFSDETLIRGGQCARCDSLLEEFEPKKIPTAFRREAKQISGLVSSCAKTRESSLAAMPEAWRNYCTTSIFEVLQNFARWSWSCQPNLIPRQIHELASASDVEVAALGSAISGLRLMQRSDDTLLVLLSQFEPPPRPRTLRNIIGPLISPFKYPRCTDPAVQKLQSDIARAYDAATPAWVKVDGDKVIPLLQEGLAKARTVCQDLGIHNRALKRLIDSGACVLSRSDGAKVRAIVDIGRVEQAVKIWRASMKYPSAASCLGVPTVIVSALLELGLIERETDPNAEVLAGEKIIKESSVNGLLARAAAIANDSSGRLLPLHRALRGWIEPSGWARKILQALTGEIECSNPDDGAFSLKDLKVPSPTFDPWWSRFSPGPDDDQAMSKNDMCLMLGWSPPVGYAAWNYYVVSRGQSDEAIPTVGDVKKIGRRYITAYEISEDIGIERKSVRHFMEKHDSPSLHSTKCVALYDRARYQEIKEDENRAS